LKSLPFPLAEALLCRGIAATAGLNSVSGLLTLAVQDGDLRFDRSTAGRLTADGRLLEVPWARCADRLLVAGRVANEDIVAIFGLKSDDVQLEHGVNIAGEPRDNVTLRSAEAVEWVAGPGLSDGSLRCHLALARSAMMVGAAESALKLAIRYSGERRQFGRALFDFQAIQQMLAVLAGEVTAAKTITRAAFANAQREPQAFDVAVAKVRAGRVAEIAATIAHQVHGAIGFAREHPLHLHTRRLWSWRAEAGAEAYWAEHIGRGAIARGGQQFWADLTASQAARA
jgi:acyl-CoA dehydrogenase